MLKNVESLKPLQSYNGERARFRPAGRADAPVRESNQRITADLEALQRGLELVTHKIVRF